MGENIRKYLKEIGKNRKNWIDASQDRDCWRVFLITALNLRVP